MGEMLVRVVCLFCDLVPSSLGLFLFLNWGGGLGRGRESQEGEDGE